MTSATPECVFHARNDADRMAAHHRGLPNLATPVLVLSNGSGLVEDVGTLFDALASFTLSPRFRDYGNFRIRPEQRPDTVMFWGNFHDASHVFDVRCIPGSEIALRLHEAIEKNIATPAYARACDEEDRHQAGRLERESAEANSRGGRV